MKDSTWTPAVWPSRSLILQWRGPDALAALDTLIAGWEAVERGASPPEGIVDLVVRAGGEWPPRRGDSPEPVEAVARNEELARVALDHEPAAGEDGPRGLLGPFARTLDVRDPWSRRAWISAVASLALYVPEAAERSPLRGWRKDHARHRTPAHDRMLAVARAPWGAWRLDERVGDAWRVTPLLPSRTPWHPVDPVALGDTGGVLGGPVEGGLWLARMVPTTQGWTARLGLVLPEVPSSDLLLGWLMHASAPMMVTTHELSMEDLLRRGGHHIVREAHRWAWTRTAPSHAR